jgi:superfamily II DNA/RNA helicase
VATDIAARGVHVDDVELVVHCDPPAEHKAYLHRSGRTARAGQSGDVVTVVLPEQRKDTQVLLRKAGITATPQQVGADSAAVRDLVGQIAPYQAPPVSQPEPAPRKNASRGPGAGPRRPGTASKPRTGITSNSHTTTTSKPHTAKRRKASRAAGAAAF